MITRRIQKIGDSLCIIIPRDIARLMGLKQGDVVSLDPKRKQLTLIMKKQKL